MDSYRIPTTTGASEYVDKRSRFLGLVQPVGSEDEARAVIAACKKQYHDARHNCWCYLLRDGTERYSDDGEPQGTAGIPMLEVFRRAGVTNAVCVVTRYFGGVLLGTGGLLRAYTAAAADALSDAGISEVRRWLACEVSTPYALYEPVRAAVAALGGVVQETQYAAAVTLCALLPEEVFAFTPKGDVINLPAGANCIDFAYAIHSAVGNRMVGCKVNNRIVPIDHVVATGEIIEVILGPADKGPSRDWLKIVRTSEAKSKIRNWFKKMRREENIQQGRDALAKELRREMIFIPDDQLDEFVGSCSRRLRQNNAEEIYAAIGYGGMTIANCLPKLKEEWQKLKAAEAAENKSVEDLPKVDLSRVHATDGVVVEGFDNTPIKFAKCCSPLPGDPIVGFITRGFGVSIHKQSCANAVSSMKDPSNAPRWVKAYWADSVKDSYKAGLEIIALNRNELLSDVLAALADIRVPIYAMNARQVENNCAVISLTIGINNTEHLNRVVARLSKVKDVLKVTRS